MDNKERELYLKFIAYLTDELEATRAALANACPERAWPIYPVHPFWKWTDRTEPIDKDWWLHQPTVITPYTFEDKDGVTYVTNYSQMGSTKRTEKDD